MINIFYGKIVVEGYSPRAMMATSGTEVHVVDHPNTRDILNFEFLDSIAAS